MPITLSPNQGTQQTVNTAPQITKPLPSSSYDSQSAGGAGVALQPLMQALIAQKQKNLLASKLPGTAPVPGSVPAQASANAAQGNWDGSGTGAAAPAYGTPAPLVS